MPLARAICSAASSGQRFAGGPNPEGEGWVPNITQKGLGEWSDKEIVYFLETGRHARRRHRRRLDGARSSATRRNSAAEDRAAMAAYLKSLPPVEGPPRPAKKE